MCDLGGMQGSVGSGRALAHGIHIPGAIHLVCVDQGVILRMLHIFAMYFDIVRLFIYLLFLILFPLLFFQLRSKAFI